MAKVLFVIAQKDFRDEELFETKEVLEQAGIQCEVASVKKELAVGMLGAKVMPDLLVKDAKTDYDAIAVVGGQGAPALAEHKEVLDLIKKFEREGKVVASICLAGIVLAKAGVLKGKRATVWSSPDYQEPINILKSNGAIYEDKGLVQDDKLITACGPKFAKKFGEAIKKSLGG